MLEGSDAVPGIRWGRILAVIILAVFALEVFSQLVVYCWAGKRYDSFSNYVWSPYGLVRSNPRLTNPAYQINSNGFREVREYSRRKPPGTIRILFLGGSVLFSGVAGTTFPGQARVPSSQTISQYLSRELRSDPAFAGVGIEVINAAVNFNRFSEIAASYVAEYLDWQPDIVIVGGTVNGFSAPPLPGQTAAGESYPQRRHEWRLDFERQANDDSFLALGERVRLTLAGHSALFGILSKGLTKGVDLLLGLRSRGSIAQNQPMLRPGYEIPEVVDHDEWSKYLDVNAAYAQAMISAGRARGQRVLFFWEHLLLHLDGIKPLSEKERWLFARNNPAYPREAGDALNPDRFYTWSRIHFSEELNSSGSRLLDPLEALRTSSETVFIDYGHYTAEGNQFMARFLAGALHDEILAAAASLKTR